MLGGYYGIRELDYAHSHDMSWTSEAVYSWREYMRILYPSVEHRALGQLLQTPGYRGRQQVIQVRWKRIQKAKTLPIGHVATLLRFTVTDCLVLTGWM